MLRSGLTLLMILLAVPAWAGKRLGGGSHGGGFPGGAFPGGVVYRGHFHDDGFAFRRNVHRSRDLLIVYGKAHLTSAARLSRTPAPSRAGGSHYLGVDLKVAYCPNSRKLPLVGRP